MTAYAVVKFLALYAGCFLGCYYWPLLLYSLIGMHGDPESYLVAGVLIAPLGFIIMGVTLGKYTAIAHVILLVIGAAAAALGYTQFLDNKDMLERLIAIWTPVILLVYMAGFAVALRHELKQE